MGYKHLGIKERGQIEILLREGRKQEYIATALGRSQSTISRELSRNTSGKEMYIADRAHHRYSRRMYWQRAHASLKGFRIREYVEDKLRKKRWSPETIAGRLKKELGLSIHYDTIYRHIYSKRAQHLELWQFLTLKRKSRRKRRAVKSKKQNIADRVSIDHRPEVVDSRSRIGDWETDNMEGIRGDTNSVSVTIERKSRYTWLVD